MADSQQRDPGKGVSDSLKDAIEGAFTATGKTRDRAQDLLDEVSKRGQGAREALEGLRLISRDDLRELERQVAELGERVERLEARSKQASGD